MTTGAAKLEVLWRLADEGHRAGQSRDATFEEVGLILDRTLERPDYDSTPGNARAFARTGGDGVHFCFLVGEAEAIRDDCPIVMCVPASSRGNVIVGADLVEFLALGTRFGFFVLEQIVYERERFLDAYADGDDRAFALRGEGAWQIQRIADAFGIAPWRDVRARLAELESHEAGMKPPLPGRAPATPPSLLDFWESSLRVQESRPDDERDEGTIAMLRSKLAQLRSS